MALAVAEWKCNSDQDAGWTAVEFISGLVIWAKHRRKCLTRTVMGWGTVKLADADNNRRLLLTAMSLSDVWDWVKGANSASFHLHPINVAVLTPDFPFGEARKFILPDLGHKMSKVKYIWYLSFWALYSNAPGFTEIVTVAILFLDFFVIEVIKCWWRQLFYV